MPLAFFLGFAKIAYPPRKRRSLIVAVGLPMPKRAAICFAVNASPA